MFNVVIYGKNTSSIILRKLVASGLVDISNGKFSNIRVTDSEFKGRLTFNDTNIETAVFENIKVNLDLTLVKAKSVDIKQVIFLGAESSGSKLQYGLTCELAKLGQLNVMDCSFQGFGGRLHFSGENPPRQIVEKGDPKLINAYSTDIGKLLISNTPVDEGKFKYMNVGQFEMENLVLGDADFSYSSIQNFVTRNVRLNGHLKLENTRIVRNASDLKLR